MGRFDDPISVGEPGGDKPWQPKVTQEAAGYEPKAKRDRKCEACAHFEPPNACDYVADEISPKGWCQLWWKVQAKDQAAAATAASSSALPIYATRGKARPSKRS